MEYRPAQVAVVTGASSGMGAATAYQLALTGMMVIGLARRTPLIDKLNDGLPGHLPRIRSIFCDVTKPHTITSAFNYIEKKYGRIDVLVNCAGIVRINTILGNQTSPTSSFELQNVVNTNLMGSIYTTRAAYPIMEKNQNYAQIVQIDSEWGHRIPTDEKYLLFRNTYPVSKFGVTALGEIIRLELNSLNNTKVRYTNISPGWVKTNILIAAGYEFSEEFFASVPHLQPTDIAASILYILSLPKNVVIPELAIEPTGFV